MQRTHCHATVYLVLYYSIRNHAMQCHAMRCDVTSLDLHPELLCKKHLICRGHDRWDERHDPHADNDVPDRSMCVRRVSQPEGTSCLPGFARNKIRGSSPPALVLVQYVLVRLPLYFVL